MPEISILLPSRNEMFLARTIQDLLEHSETDIEIIVVLDGAWADPAVPQDPKVNIIYLPESIGQRSATSLAAKLAKGKYVCKVDAHTSYDQGWDKKMLDGFKANGDKVTMVPVMRNLWVFDWKCYHCGWKKYQGPTPPKCEACGKTDKIRRKMIWSGKHNPQSVSYCFDTDPHFQYFEDYKHREPFLTDKKTGFTETMSLQGSFWMMSRERYLEYIPYREGLGSWGNEGLEMACKEWLSGGRVLVNHNTWYAHLFRTQGGNFGFPYVQSGKHVSRTKKRVKEMFWNMKAPNQIHPVSWLVRKFSPISWWTPEKIAELKAREKELNVI